MTESSAIYSYQYGPGFSEWIELYIVSDKIKMTFTPNSYKLESLQENVEHYDMTYRISYFNIKVNSQWVDQMKQLYQEQMELQKRIETVGVQLTQHIPSIEIEDKINLQKTIQNIQQKYCRFDDHLSRFHANPNDIKVLKQMSNTYNLNTFAILKVAEGFYYRFVN